ncbi:MAG: ABC transporter permease/substrate-binding protein [Acidobacteria bacterium]|nr:ABC transporter permease/substrate-binding protein [Acidobacteriota bacterium]
MNLLEFISQNWYELLVLTREHIVLVFISTSFAVLAGVPLGILLTRFKSLQAPVLGFANVMQTVPSLALFGLLIPIPFVGGIGAKTAIIALALYALLPVIRNTVMGILGIDSKITEAATAMGMTDRQRLRIIELPIAAPVILTGIRVSTVISVGVSTIAAAIGAGGLGTYIFRGLRQNDSNLLLAGAIASALLALFCDFALGQVERSYAIGSRKSRARRKFVLAAAGLVATGLLGTVLFSNFRSEISETGSKKIVVGSKDFTESVILAEILAQVLEIDGVAVERRFELGGNIPHESLLAGEIDVYPEYTGTAYTAILKTYGFSFARQPREMDLALTYRALAAGELDIIAGNSTDGLIAALDLVQLEDDRHYFPPYQAVFVARNDGLDTLKTAFERLNNLISTDTMRQMNYAVDAQKVPPKEIATEWLGKAH